MSDNVILLILLFATAVVAALVRDYWPGRRHRRRRWELPRRSADPHLEPRPNLMGSGYHYRLGALSRSFRKRRRGN